MYTEVPLLYFIQYQSTKGRSLMRHRSNRCFSHLVLTSWSGHNIDSFNAGKPALWQYDDVQVLVLVLLIAVEHLLRESEEQRHLLHRRRLMHGQCGRGRHRRRRRRRRRIRQRRRRRRRHALAATATSSAADDERDDASADQFGVRAGMGFNAVFLRRVPRLRLGCVN